MRHMLTLALKMNARWSGYMLDTPWISPALRSSHHLLYVWDELISFNEADRITPFYGWQLRLTRFCRLPGGEFAGWVMGPQWTGKDMPIQRGKGRVIKNLPVNIGDTRDVSSSPGLGRSAEEEMATDSSNLAWKVPQTEERGGLQSMRSQRIRCDWATEHSIAHTSTGGSHTRG